MAAWPGTTSAEPKQDKIFTAIVTDNQGVETELRNVVFYWEERLSETSFVPHELRYLPVKRGSTVTNVAFDKIKQLEMKPSVGDGVGVSVLLVNGKTGEFVLTIMGSFRGESEFGQADVPAKAASKVIMK
ncbi:MAG TPA: hypothetical protein VJ746_03200 [Nitrospira sp.]|nr:hypothetical protein [Nitrospira sp.]